MSSRLSERVRDRMLELGLSQYAIWQSGNVSKESVANILRGGNARPSTLKRLDAELRWEAGSSANIVKGGEPVPLPAEPEQPLVAALAAELPTMRQATSLLRVLADGGEPVQADLMRAPVDALSGAVDRFESLSAQNRPPSNRPTETEGLSPR